MVGMDLSAKVSFNTSESERMLSRHIAANSEQERKTLEEKITAIVTENQKLLAEYEQSIVRAEDRAAFDKLIQIRTAYGAERARTMELSKAGKREEAEAQQAASLEETSSSLEEMSSMTRRNADNADNAKALADQTRVAADTGANDMKEMSAFKDLP